MLDHLNKDVFAQHLNTKFRLGSGAPEPVEVELIEVKEGKSTPRQEQFSILFLGPQKPFLVQKLYHFEHDHLGAFELFIVPVGQTESGFHYEAVFNRLRDKMGERENE